MDETYGYSSAMRKFFRFSGRSPRKEYWMFILVYFVITFIASLIDAGLGFTGDNGGPVGGLVGLVHLIPSLSVTVRRLHDIGRSGWWLIAPLAAVILAFLTVGLTIGLDAFSTGDGLFAGAAGILFGALMLAAFVLVIVLFVFTLLRSQEGTNRYGPHPYGEVDTNVF